MLQPKLVLLLTSVTQGTDGSTLAFLPPTELITALRAKGASVQLKCWRDADIISAIDRSDVISFLPCYDYNHYAREFLSFLNLLKKKIDSPHSIPDTINSIDVVRWNVDKRYLLDLQRAGFDIPRTHFIDADYHSESDWWENLQAFKPSGSIVVKPAVSGLAWRTRRVEDTAALTPEDLAFLRSCTPSNLGSSVILQEFEPAVLDGEYSFVFINLDLVKIVRKTPRQGDFRAHAVYGSSTTFVRQEDIDGRTLSVVRSMVEFMVKRFGADSMAYLRVDGIVMEDRPFVVMEVEAIEPGLWLEQGGMEELVERILEPPHHT